MKDLPAFQDKLRAQDKVRQLIKQVKFETHKHSQSIEDYTPEEGGLGIAKVKGILGRKVKKCDKGYESVSP